MIVDPRHEEAIFGYSWAELTAWPWPTDVDAQNDLSRAFAENNYGQLEAYLAGHTSTWELGAVVSINDYNGVLTLGFNDDQAPHGSSAFEEAWPHGTAKESITEALVRHAMSWEIRDEGNDEWGPTMTRYDAATKELFLASQLDGFPVISSLDIAFLINDGLRGDELLAAIYEAVALTDETIADAARRTAASAESTTL